MAPIVSAKIIGHTGDVAPVPQQPPLRQLQRHRTHRRLQRRLEPAPAEPTRGPPAERAIHVIAIYQISHPGPGRDYYLKKLAQAKTPKEACRAKRRHSDTVYRHLIIGNANAIQPLLDTEALLV